MPPAQLTLYLLILLDISLKDKDTGIINFKIFITEIIGVFSLGTGNWSQDLALAGAVLCH